MTDLAGAIAGMSPDNVIRTGTVTGVNPLKLNVGGGIVEDAGTLSSVAVGDTVACVRQGQTWLVLGKVTPASTQPPGGVFGSEIQILPPQGAGSKAIIFNHGYAIYVDNAGAGGNGTRFWLDVPGGGEIVLGPRSGSSFLGQIRIRTDDTTALAANTVLDGDVLKKSTSSLRYKTTVEDAGFDPEQVLALRAVRFRDRAEYADKGDDARQYVGLIAEEVDALGLQEFVFYDGEGRPDGVQYDRLAVALLDIVKDLAGRLAALEERS